MSGKTEFRVVWKREGLRKKSRRFAYLVTAQKHAARLSDGDLHYRCDEAHGYFDGPDWHPTCMPPIVLGPLIEERNVSPWRSQ